MKLSNFPRPAHLRERHEHRKRVAWFIGPKTRRRLARGVHRRRLPLSQQNKSKGMIMIKSMKIPTTPGDARRSMGLSRPQDSVPQQASVGRGIQRSVGLHRKGAVRPVGRASPGLPHHHHAAKDSPSPAGERIRLNSSLVRLTPESRKETAFLDHDLALDHDRFPNFSVPAFMEGGNRREPRS